MHPTHPNSQISHEDVQEYPPWEIFTPTHATVGTQTLIGFHTQVTCPGCYRAFEVNGPQSSAYSSTLHFNIEYQGRMGHTADSLAIPTSSNAGFPSPSLYNNHAWAQETSFRFLSVPQRLYQSKTSKKCPDNATIVYMQKADGTPFPIIDALEGRFSELLDRDRTGVLGDCGVGITLRFEWPGYLAWSHQIKTRDCRAQSNPVPMSKLVLYTARALRSFIENKRRENAHPEGFWSFSPENPWMNMENIYLGGLQPASKGSWQPLFYVLADN